MVHVPAMAELMDHQVAQQLRLQEQQAKLRLMVPLELRLPQQLFCARTCILAYGDSVSADKAVRRGANSRRAVADSSAESRQYSTHRRRLPGERKNSLCIAVAYGPGVSAPDVSYPRDCVYGGQLNETGEFERLWRMFRGE